MAQLQEREPVCLIARLNQRLGLTRHPHGFSGWLDPVQRFYIVVQNFVLDLIGEIVAVLRVAQICRELAVPVRDVGGVDEMILADVAKRLRQQ